MRTTKVLSVTLPDEMLAQAKRRAKLENRTMSELVREALRQYEWSRFLRDTQAYGRKRAEDLGITEADVNRLIKEYRAESHAGEGRQGKRIPEHRVRKAVEYGRPKRPVGGPPRQKKAS